VRGSPQVQAHHAGRRILLDRNPGASRLIVVTPGCPASGEVVASKVTLFVAIKDDLWQTEQSGETSGGQRD